MYPTAPKRANRSAHRSKLSAQITVLVITVVISVLTMSLPSKSVKMAPTSPSPRSPVKIEYKLVEEKDGKHKRFAAYITSDDHATKPLSIKQWAEYLSGDNGVSNQGLIEGITKLINQSTTKTTGTTSSYKAYFFETKGVSLRNASEKQFEFVLVNSDHLFNFCESDGPKPETFGKNLNCSSSKETCCIFSNLGNTATLISPKDLGDYSHIGKFFRTASKNEIIQLWEKIARGYLNALRENPTKSLWLSTSGMGVPWLHFRIDEVPKYYTFKQFAQEK
jgi:hypothetical protein